MSEFLRRFEKLLGLFFWGLLFYLLCRVEFLVWNWAQFKAKPTGDILWAFINGFRFDLSSVSMNLVPAILLSFWPWSAGAHRRWQVLAFWLYAPFALTFSIMNLGDTEFVNFVGRRFTYDAFFIVTEIPGKLGALFETYWFLFSFNVVVMIVYTLGSWKILQREDPHRWGPSSKREGSFYFLSMLMIIILVVVGIRGGLQRKPMNVVSAHVFATPLLNNLVLNSTYTFIKSFGVETLGKEVYFKNREDMLKQLNGAVTGPSLLDGRRAKTPQNVVIIILESFGREYMGEVNGDAGYTPFLDSLTHRGLFFSNGYANARRSIEGVAAVMAGIPALMSEPFISSQFVSNYFVGLGSMLNGHQYHTSFFHGGHNGTMYFDAFAKSAGLDTYYGAAEYPNGQDNDGTWGIFDEPFLQFMKTKLDNSPRPFMAGVFTLSSHNPYKLPDEYVGRFPKGPIEILETVGYADHALQRFFEEAAKSEWYKDTLFVITADHTSLNFRPQYDNELSHYKVPILFFHPGYSWPSGIDTLAPVQQIDILPSILDFLGMQNKDVNFLGRSVFVPGERTATMYIDGRYMLAAKDFYLDWAKDSPVKMYNIADVAEKVDLNEPASRKAELESRLKASIQYFNEAMWDNRLYYPSGK
jgi:phosphoglycerol transferase MdoB-like AlkP superfamily enzyme